MTLISFANKVPMYMKRLASLTLLLVLAGSALAGVPLQFGESECSLDGMMDMDCCKAALMKAQTAESASARLCCALNCSKEGTSPTNGLWLAPQLQLLVQVYPADAHGLLSSIMPPGRIDRSHGPPADSQPAYIRHLALLI